MSEGTEKHTKNLGSEPFRLRSKSRQEVPAADQKRFDIFLVDTGWNSPVARLVREQVPVLFHYNPHDSLYILSHEQSLAIIKKDPEQIGKDPILLVYDLYAGDNNPGNYRGFRLNLGLIRHADQALARLQDFVKFIAIHRQSTNLAREITKELHHEGYEGMVKILTETATELI